MSEPGAVNLDPEDARHSFQATMELLTSLEDIGQNVQPESSLAYMRGQVAHNVNELLRGYYVKILRSFDSQLKAILDPLPGQRRADYKDDPIMLSVLALMDAFDRHDWRACVSELKALKLVMKVE